MRTITAWCLLLLLIFGEATTVASTIKRRTHEYRQFLKGNRRQQSAAAPGPAKNDNFDGTITISSKSSLVASLVEKNEVSTTAKLGVGCFGLCTALIIITVVATSGAAVASAVNYMNAAETLAELDTVVDSNQEFGVGNCFDMRKLVFDLEMSQVAFNLLFQEAKVSQFLDLDDMKDVDGKKLTKDYWVCKNEDGVVPFDKSLDMPIVETIGDKEHVYSELSRDEFYSMHKHVVLKVSEINALEELLSNINDVRRDVIENWDKAKECNILNLGGCNVCVGNQRATKGIYKMTHNTCSWCEPDQGTAESFSFIETLSDNDDQEDRGLEPVLKKSFFGKCTSNPKKKCNSKKGEGKGIEWKVIQHSDHDSCPRMESGSDEEQKFLEFIGGGNIEYLVEGEENKRTITVNTLMSYKQEKERLKASWETFEKEIKEKKKKLNDEYKVELKICEKWKEQQIQESQKEDANVKEFNKKMAKTRERFNIANNNYHKLSESVKDFNNNMGDIVEKLVQNACSGNTQGGYDRMIQSGWEDQKKEVSGKKWQLIFDSIAAIFAIIGVHNEVGKAGGTMKTLTEAIAASKTTSEFVLYVGVLINNQASNAFLNGMLEVLRQTSHSKEIKTKLTTTEMFFGFMALTGVITRVVSGFAGAKSVGGIISKILGKIAKLVAGIVGAILAVKHLYDRVMGVISARQEYAARSALAVVNAKLSRSETMFTQCGLIRGAFDLQQAQEKTLEGFFALSQNDDDDDDDDDAINESTEIPVLNNELKKTCTKYSKNCWTLLKDNEVFRRSILSHDGGKDLLTDLAVKILHGPITDIAIMNTQEKSKYENIGYKVVPDFGAHQLSNHGCKGLTEKICSLRGEVCEWKTDKCENKGKSKKYTLMFCHGCTGARPITELKIEKISKDKFGPPKKESYLFKKGNDGFKYYIVIKRSKNFYKDIEEKFVTSINGKDAKITFGTKMGKEEVINLHKNQKEHDWWNPSTTSVTEIKPVTVIANAEQSADLQKKAKPIQCKGQQTSAQFLLDKCTLHGDSFQKVNFPVSLYDEVSALHGAYNCQLNEGKRCAVDSSAFPCTMSSWMMPGGKEISGNQNKFNEGNNDIGKKIVTDESKKPWKLKDALYYYNLDSKANRRKQHIKFEYHRCGYRKFIPITFTLDAEDCKEPRLALGVASRQSGFDYQLKEICSKEEARKSGETTMMKVDPSLYYIEIVFKEGKQYKCGSTTGSNPDWFCSPRANEINDAFEAGWSMLPFKFFKRGEETFNGASYSDVAFNMRVWARMDKRIEQGSQNGVAVGTDGDKSEREYFKSIVDHEC